MGIKRGIIQSRGLGDILIALPIARYYYEQGDEIVWPICDDFYGSVKAIDWITWVPMKQDPAGAHFMEQPLKIFKYHDVDVNEALYLYHYLNTLPELTDPELFNILKFDQYKYQVAGVPFKLKWTLGDIVPRDVAREEALRLRVNPPARYAVAHLTGSSAKVDVQLINFLDPAVKVINVDDYLTDSIFDWRALLEGAEAVVCLDSAMSNMVDQLGIRGPELYWIRRSPWDLTPVMGLNWTIVPTNLPIVEPTRVDPAAEADKKRAQTAPQGTAGGLISHVPFETDKSAFPTSFMSALNGGAGQKPNKPNAAQDLYKSLGVR